LHVKLWLRQASPPLKSGKGGQVNRLDSVPRGGQRKFVPEEMRIEGLHIFMSGRTSTPPPTAKIGQPAVRIDAQKGKFGEDDALRAGGSRTGKEGRSRDRAYESQSRASLPEDLELALARNPRAKKFFATLDSRSRYAVPFRVQHAKKAETRARPIAQFVEMLARGEKLHP
jgi:hypothetical protein